MSRTKEKIPKKLWPFTKHGVAFDADLRSGDNYMAGCPFCGDDDHFFASPDTGLWKCHKCQEKGNVYQFLDKISRFRFEQTRKKQWKALSELREIPAEAFKRHGVAWDGDQWIFPSRNAKGSVRDIRCWKEGSHQIRATKGCKTQLWGAERLAKARPGTEVWICEGEWDGMVLDWLFHSLGLSNYVVVAVPGADIFKQDWVELFNGMKVYVCYDADETGDRGAEKVRRLLKGHAKWLKFLNWPESRPEGWDIRDHARSLLAKDKSHQSLVRRLNKLMEEAPRRKDPETGKSGDTEQGEGGGGEYEPLVLPPDERPSFRRVLKTFGKWLKMTEDLEDGVRVILATIISEQIPGEPLWFYIVGAPGSGKTQLLTSAQGSDRTIFRSTVTPHSLVSGFKMDPDPSLLGKVDKRTLIFKDGTEVLTLPQFQQDEIYGILRGAFDGHVEKSFGNNVHREYWLHFSLLFGVTPKIYGHQTATLGERFLKFTIGNPRDPMKQILAAMDNTGKEKEMQEALQDAVTPFLALDITEDELPKVPRWMKERIAYLGQLVSMLRANVDRDKYTQEITYEPGYEVATRLGKQLIKLGMALAIVHGETEVGAEEFRLMERVALDTAIGFHAKLVRVVVTAENPLSAEEVAEATHIPTTTLYRNLDDLMLLGVLRKIRDEDTEGTGRKRSLWRPSSKFRKLWDGAHIGEPARKRKD